MDLIVNTWTSSGSAPLTLALITATLIVAVISIVAFMFVYDKDHRGRKIIGRTIGIATAATLAIMIPSPSHSPASTPPTPPPTSKPPAPSTPSPPTSTAAAPASASPTTPRSSSPSKKPKPTNSPDSKATPPPSTATPPTPSTETTPRSPQAPSSTAPPPPPRTATPTSTTSSQPPSPAPHRQPPRPSPPPSNRTSNQPMNPEHVPRRARRSTADIMSQGTRLSSTPATRGKVVEPVVNLTFPNSSSRVPPSSSITHTPTPITKGAR